MYYVTVRGYTYKRDMVNPFADKIPRGILSYYKGRSRGHVAGEYPMIGNYVVRGRTGAKRRIPELGIYTACRYMGTGS